MGILKLLFILFIVLIFSLYFSRSIIEGHGGGGGGHGGGGRGGGGRGGGRGVDSLLPGV